MIKAVLFDLDGVLIDSKESTIDFIREAFKHFNYPVPDAKDFIPYMFGLKVREIIKILLPSGASEEEISKISKYGMGLSEKYVGRILPMQNAALVLKKLKKRHKIALITNRGKITTQMILKLHKLDIYFDLVIDRDDLKNHKPHPEGLLTAMRSFAIVNLENAVYIGDTGVDVEAAKNANIKSILISDTKEDFGADFKISHISKLPFLIKKLHKDHLAHKITI